MCSCMLGWFSTSYRGLHPVWANSERPHTLLFTFDGDIVTVRTTACSLLRSCMVPLVVDVAFG